MNSPRPRYHLDPGFIFTLPWLIGVLALVATPLLFSVGLSFVRWEGIDAGRMQWVGTKNYEQLILADEGQPVRPDSSWHWSLLGGKPHDPLFYRSILNTLIFSIFATPLSIFSALGLAMLLNVPLRGMAVFRSLVYLPHVLGGVATILIWSWVFNPTFGPVNSLIRFVYHAIDPIVRLFHASGTTDWALPGWLASPTWCMPAVILIHTWTAGGSVFIFLAALGRLDPDTHLASMLDGANGWQRFLRISLPQLTPAILFNLITGFVASTQSFNYAYLLYNRAQNDGLLFVVLQIYRCAFEPPYRLGYASAMACILFLMLLGFSALAVKTSKRWVYYES